MQHTAYICSTHFCENSFQPITPTGKHILKRDACPSILYIKSEEIQHENNIINVYYFRSDIFNVI